MKREDGYTGYLRLSVLSSGTYAVEEFATSAKIEAKVEVVGCLKIAFFSMGWSAVDDLCTDLEVIVQCHDVRVTTRYPLQDGNLVANLKVEYNQHSRCSAML
jgi:hypothetical protein